MHSGNSPRWELLPQELQEKILTQLPLQRGSRLSQTSRTFRRVLDHHHKILQHNDLEGFVVDALKFLATQPEKIDPTVLMTMQQTVFLGTDVSAFDYDGQEARDKLRLRLLVLLRVGVEPWARHIEDPNAQGRFLSRVAHVFRHAHSSCSEVPSLRQVSLHCCEVAQQLGLDDKIRKRILQVPSPRRATG